MSTSAHSVLDDLTLDHVRFYVRDSAAAASGFTTSYGMAVLGDAPAHGREDAQRSVALGFGSSTIVLTEPTAEQHPGNEFVQRHGDGVADIAFRVADAGAVFRHAIECGARPVREPHDDGRVVTATIGGFGDVVHTLVQPKHDEPEQPVHPDEPGACPEASGVTGIDHFAVCLENGQLEPVVEFYREALGFRPIFTERIEVGNQAMESIAAQSAANSVTFTFLEPMRDAQAGQIDDFLKDHGGPGVQHIALTTPDIVGCVRRLRSEDVRFLSTPGSYYDRLAERLRVRRHPIADLRTESILVDEDHDGQLFQIFAVSEHPRNTFFFEIIERIGARSFGTGNVKALYEAVEQDRIRGRE